MQSLPTPDADNPALHALIAEQIRAGEHGSISFADFMRLALYHEELGYYVCCDPTLDYQSSPNVHPIFGEMIARQLANFWRILDRPARFDVIEAGAGSGRLAADVLLALAREEPDFYDALHYTLQDEVYARPPALERLAAAALPLDKVSVAARLSGIAPVEGCILSNELLDALPFHRVRRRDERLLELCVGLDGDGFVDLEAPAPPEIERYFAAAGVLPGEGCVAEVNLAAPGWVATAAAVLRRGYLLTLDYGYEAAELYAPTHKQGTLLTFYRHMVGDDPYVRIGRQDITASVDFTAVARGAEAAGLRSYGRVDQESFLVALGIGEVFSRRPAWDALESYYAQRRAVLDLVDEASLGRISALLHGKGTPDTLPLGLTPLESR